MNVVGWMHPTSPDFDVVLDTAPVPLVLRNCREHLGPTGILNTHEYNTNWVC